MAHLFARLRLTDLTKVPVRHRGRNHWLEVKKRRSPMDRALDHFDELYGSVYGDGWQNIRTALLRKEHKYMAVVNNFSDAEKTRVFLEEQGAINLKSVYDVFNEHMEEKNQRNQRKKNNKSEKSGRIGEQMSTVLSDIQASKVQSIYPADYEEPPRSLQSEANDDKETQELLESAQLRPIESDLNEVSIDSDRIVKPCVSVSSLYEYIPATKIKGMNDWVLESEYYQHYPKESDFSIQVSQETTIAFPKYLHAYAFEANNHTKFPAPKAGSTDNLDYYLFDGASILPVLALDLKGGDVVLDMCAAPGGKALAIMQTLAPGVLILNDIMESRVNRIHKVLDQFTKGFRDSYGKVFVTQQDARVIDETGVYNKILVDVPCTTDRHSLHSDENNIFKATRIKERLKIPEQQTEILVNALTLVKVGGTVVYSTCSLCPVQNEGVVQTALKKVWEKNNSTMVVKDMTRALQPLYPFFKFGNYGLKYGHIAIPTLKNNWGPMYFCKIERIE